MPQDLTIQFRLPPTMRARCVLHNKLLFGPIRWESVWGKGDQPSHAYMTRPELYDMVCPAVRKVEGELQPCSKTWIFEVSSQTRRVAEMHIK